MRVGDETDLEALLSAVNAGEAGATDALCAAIHEQMRAMARRHLARDGVGRQVTIQPTILANDTLLRLIRQRTRFDNGGQFFALASRMMMQLLLDYHRQRKAAKRGGGAVHVPLDPQKHDPAAPPETGADVERVNDALERLAALDARKADVVRYRVLWGLTVPEIGDALGVSVATVERDWSFAKAWLAKELLRPN